MSEHEAHLQSCAARPALAPSGRRSRYELMGQIHVCEHVAAAIAAREYFTGYGVRDDDALDQLQIGCRVCEERVDGGGKPGPRWRACSGCFRALRLPHGWGPLAPLAPRP